MATNSVILIDSSVYQCKHYLFHDKRMLILSRLAWAIGALTYLPPGYDCLPRPDELRQRGT